MKARRSSACAKLLRAGVAIASLATPTAVYAQDQGGLEEIIVTAQRRDTSLQTTPVSITALTGDALEQARVLDTRALETQTPGLQIIPSGGGSPVSLIVALRGQFQNGINITNDPSVALYIDNIYIGKDAGNVTDVVDVAQIEVLKGPQGTLFGRNSTGGAILYESRKPDFSGFSGSLRGSYGNFNSYQLQGVFNVPLSESVAIRYAGSYRQHDGYTTTHYVTFAGAAGVLPVATRETDNLESQLHRFSILLEPSDALQVHATATYHNRQIDGYLGRNLRGDRHTAITSATFDPSPSFVADFYSGELNARDAFGRLIEPEVYTKGWLFTGNLSYALNDTTTFKAILGYSSNKIANTDFDVDGIILPISHSSTFQNFKQFSSEFQLTGTMFGDRLDYVAGVYYLHERGVDQTDSQALGAGGASHNLNNGVGINKSLSGFVHGKYKVGEDTTLQVGVRYTEDRKRLRVSARNGVVPNLQATPPCVYAAGSANVDIANCLFTPKATFGFWSYLVGVDQQFGEGLFGYIKTSRTQRSGGHQIRATTGDIAPFGPETITDYEVGLKIDLARSVRLNLAAFYGFYKGIQNTKIVGGPGPGDNLAVCIPNDTCTGPATTVVRNEGSARVPGFEAELQARFGGFGIGGGLSYVNVDYKNPDIRQSYTPHWQYNLAATYEADVGLGQVNARVGWFGKGKVWKERSRAATRANPVVLRALPSIGVLSARIGLKTESGFDVALFGDNLTKEEYYGDALNVAGRWQTGYGFQPRTYGIEVGYAF